MLLLTGCLFCILTESPQLESSEVFKHYREVILRDKSMFMASEIISWKQLTKYLFIWLLSLILPSFIIFIGLPDSSVGKGYACNAQDPGLIPGLGRSPGEGIGYPLQYSWASLLAQLVKNPPAMQETWVQSLGWEDPLGKGEATRSSILAWRIPWTIESVGSQIVGHDWVTFTFTTLVPTQTIRMSPLPPPKW